MRVFILDSGLTALGGHHDHMAIHLSSSIPAYGAELRIYGKKIMSKELLNACPATALFSQGFYQALSKDPFDGMLTDFLAGARKFSNELLSLKNGEAPASGDIVFLPTAAPREVAGLCQWMKKSGQRPRIAMLFHSVIPNPLSMLNSSDLGEGSLLGAIYRHLGRSLAEVVRTDDILLGATTRDLARILTRPLGRPVRVMPAPVWYPPLDDNELAEPATGQSPPVVSFLGQLRAGKGSTRLAELIRSLHARGVNAHSIIHINPGPGARMPDMSEIERLQDEGLAELVCGWVSESELSRMIDRSSLVVMPYDRQRYGNTVSGIFALAAARGCPCVVPSQTWMAEQISSGKAAGVSYADDEIGTITDSVSGALASLPKLRAFALKALEAWRREESGEALVAELMSWANKKQDHLS